MTINAPTLSHVSIHLDFLKQIPRIKVGITSVIFQNIQIVWNKEFFEKENKYAVNHVINGLI